MAHLKNYLYLARTLRRQPRMLKVRPALNLFFLRYLGHFRIKDSGGHWTVHSHLPPLNHRAFGRFVDDHLLKRIAGPSHAQVGLTNACPQRCAYCYNRERGGEAMDTETILKTVRELKELGVCWLGLTGGEPLLNPDIARIVGAAAGDCAVKLFTTGSTLTREKARELARAGLFSVSVSLDHWRPEIHDRNRGLDGAFATALRAIDIFKETGGIQVGVSAVVSREMIRNDRGGGIPGIPARAGHRRGLALRSQACGGRILGPGAGDQRSRAEADLSHPGPPQPPGGHDGQLPRPF